MPVGTGCVSHRHIIPFLFFSSKSMDHVTNLFVWDEREDAQVR